MHQISSVQFSSVAQSCPTLCDPMNRSTPGLPVYQQLPEFTQTHVHRVSDAIQPSHPLSSPSPPAPNTSQHQETLIHKIPTFWKHRHVFSTTNRNRSQSPVCSFAGSSSEVKWAILCSLVSRLGERRGWRKNTPGLEWRWQLLKNGKEDRVFRSVTTREYTGSWSGLKKRPWF